VFLCDGIKGYVISTSDVVTQVTDTDFPTPHLASPVFLDGYIFVGQVNGDIWNSALDDPTSWVSTDFINAEMYPDQLVALTKQNNQVVAMGTVSTEFFYDAANPTGSPLSRNPAPGNPLGCAGADSIMAQEKTVVFVSQSETGGRAVWAYEGFEPKRVSTEPIGRILDAETTVTNIKAFGVRIMGHFFYVLNLPAQSRTLVYDIEEKMWHEWASNSTSSYVKFQCSFGTDVAGTYYLQDDTTGQLYIISPTVYQDNGTSILMKIVTSKIDFDLSVRKAMYSLQIVGDTSNTASSLISFRWSDDDYTTWSGTKTLNINAANRAIFYRLGTFRRRAFELTYTDNYPLRVESLEIAYNQGVN